jgi:hypothetical protein
MPKFVIEREIPECGKFTPEQLHAISQTSCGVILSMGPRIQWLQSYVTDNKIYCIYIAPDEATVREHATKGGFPANSVAQVRSMIDPTSSE